MREGDVRHGRRPPRAPDLEAQDALALLRAWLDSMDIDVDEHKLLDQLQEGELSHADLDRRARRVHERKLAEVVHETVANLERGAPDLGRSAVSLFDACMPAIPYAAAAAFLGREKSKLTRSDGDRPRVAVVVDGIGGMHGVTHTIQQIRARGVRGYDVEVIGTDADVDRRLSAVAEIDIPFYPGLEIGVPTLPAIVETLGRGPLRRRAPLLARAGRHRRVAAGARARPAAGRQLPHRTGRLRRAAHRPAPARGTADWALGAFYGACDVVLSPSPASDRRLAELGIASEPDPALGARRRPGPLRPAASRRRDVRRGAVNVLYCGRLTKEKGVDLLADAFLEAHRRDPRLHLVLAGGGPEEALLRERLGDRATFLGWLSGDALARAYASADAFLFASPTDTFGQVILEAQASGLPVVAVAGADPPR